MWLASILGSGTGDNISTASERSATNSAPEYTRITCTNSDR
jgi:hypothetical protein